MCKPRHQEFLAFLEHRDRGVPAELDLHLVADNYGTHKHAKVKTWLARHPRYHFHYTPTYASWLNQVERWFGLITQQAIRRGAFRCDRFDKPQGVAAGRQNLRRRLMCPLVVYYPRKRVSRAPVQSRKLIHEEIAQQYDARGLQSLAWGNQANWQITGCVTREDAHEIFRPRARQQRHRSNPYPGENRLMQRGDFIYHHRARNFDGYLPRAVAEPPGVFAAASSEENAVVLCQIIRPVGSAVALDVLLAGKQCCDHVRNAGLQHHRKSGCQAPDEGKIL